MSAARRRLLIDASVAVVWFDTTNEPAVADCVRLLHAASEPATDAHVLDLTYFEVANVLLRSKGATVPQVDAAFALLREICASLALTDDEWTAALSLTDAFGLTSYDAAYAAVAQSRGLTLVTLDRQLLDAEFGVPPSAFA